jgi:hypothetical protein
MLSLCLHRSRTSPRRDAQGDYERCLDCGARICWAWQGERLAQERSRRALWNKALLALHTAAISHAHPIHLRPRQGRRNSMSSKLILAITVLMLAGAWQARADKIALTDGTQVKGIITKIEKGQVFIQDGMETKVFDILSVSRMDFDTPHLLEGTPRLPAEHFHGPMEASEMTQHLLAVEQAAADTRLLVDQTRTEWSSRTSITAADVPQWEAAKLRFRAPLSRYQEHLNDLYFHVLGKVDEYNTLTKQANQIYVGVKGVFNVGSALIPKDLEKLPLKKYVPDNWYDTIFYEGYDQGYRDAFEKYSRDPYGSYSSR